MKLESNNTGTFTEQDSVTFDPSLWSATNGTTNWSSYPQHIPYTENAVYHTQLTHTAGLSADVGWTIRIGKGGQIYYIDIENFGQIICPNSYRAPWNDDCMTTTVYSYDETDTDTELKIGNDSLANGYIHGSGMYIKPHMDPLNNKPFYNPVLAEHFDPTDRSYSTINWGLVPVPSINRGDVLFYSRYRDMGNGVIELTFYYYNFGSRNYTFAETPWFGFRPSKFPNMIKGGFGGSSTFEIHNVNFADKLRVEAQRGWGAGTVNPRDPNSMTCALVWGTPTNTVANFGFVNKGERDMMLISPSKSGFSMSYGTGIMYRRYLVLGKLSNVADICSKLNQYCTFSEFNFSPTKSGKMPIYKDILEGQNVLTTEPNGSPVFYSFPVPVKKSVPLLLMKNNDSGQYFITTDPYSACGKIPFTNPYPVGHAKHEKYENRHIYQPYDGKSEWISLLGYALPDTYIKTTPIDVYIIAGQSNAHGYADISTLTQSQSSQDGIFYTSWHNSTTNAETPQYFSEVLTSLVAGKTRGDGGKSTLGGSTQFGPEMGFVARANEINLNGTNKIGIVKYAVGASSLVKRDGLSDWDLTATTVGDGDCWRGFQKALADAKTKLDNDGYVYNWKGLIWWQGESGTSVQGLSAFISNFRNLMATTYGVSNSDQFPVVITGNPLAWGNTLKAGIADVDPYVEFIDASEYGQVYVGAQLNVHIGSGENGITKDITLNGVNDMFDIGKAYADKMALISNPSIDLTLPIYNNLNDILVSNNINYEAGEKNLASELMVKSV